MGFLHKVPVHLPNRRSEVWELSRSRGIWELVPGQICRLQARWEFCNQAPTLFVLRPQRIFRIWKLDKKAWQ